MTKHQNIIEYIQKLDVGSKISVRKIAHDIGVSEGTAYRAIKDAESRELVRTFPRAGTIRIEKVEKKNIEKLTFAEVVTIVDGCVLGGNSGLSKTLNRFIIGAMTPDAMAKYISPGNLLIVGNREEVYRLALENECAILITGGFDCSEEFIELADHTSLPIISSSYDTFTIATLINKAISDRMIKKEILLIEDILADTPRYLVDNQTIRDYQNLCQGTGYSRFPVVDRRHCVVGIITSEDAAIGSEDDPISRVMTSNPITVSLKTSVAYAAHMLIWESIELLPVVDKRKLVGVVSRRDVIKALQYMKNQPQKIDTLEDMILRTFEEQIGGDDVVFKGKVIPIMLSQIGAASWGAFSMMMTTAGILALKKQKHFDAVLDSFSVYFLKPLQLEDEVEVAARIIDSGRFSNKIEIEVWHNSELTAKAVLSAKTMRK